MQTCSIAPAARPLGLRILPATPDDAGLLCEMIRELAAFEHLAHECRITEEIVRDCLLKPGRRARALVAWLGDEPAGFAVYYRTFSTFEARSGLFLEDLYVRSGFRNRGIGRTLLSTVARIAQRMRAGRLEWATLKWNEPARRLYGRIGARELDDWQMLRMDRSAIARFGCDGPGVPNEGCRCGGTGPRHGVAEPCHG